MTRPARQDVEVTPTEAELVAAARSSQDAFDHLVSRYRGELHAHCYRMLGGHHDADDAVQDTMIGAWRGLSGFEGRSSVRSWLYRIATNACLHQLRQRPKRLLSADYHPARTKTDDLGRPDPAESWIEPYPPPAGDLDPQARVELLESVELAFIAALQHLPGTQRAVLILREVLSYSAAEVAGMVGISVPAVNSALQRARATLDRRRPGQSQQSIITELGDDRLRRLVDDFVAAWERADVDSLLRLMTEDARFTMPPLPAWFDGPANIARFLRERVFANRWRLRPTTANGQPALIAYMGREDGAGFAVSGLTVLTLSGDRIAEITSFLDPVMYDAFEIPAPPAG